MSPELLVTGRIFSFDQGGEPFHSMLVRNGKVVELSHEPLPCSAPRLDLGEQVVVPAFIDAHMHILELGFQFIFPNFAGVDSLEAAFDLLSERQTQARELGFLLGLNLEPGDLKEQRMPNRRELDRVIPDVPLLVYRIDGHSASLNTRGIDFCIESSGILDGVELDSAREPTGILAGAAYETASRRFKSLVPREIKLLAFQQAAQDAARKGVLTLGALVGSDEPGDDIPELLVEHASGLPVEVVVFPQTRDFERVRRLALPRIGGCILIDGSFGSHTAALLEDYSDEPGNKGKLYVPDHGLMAYVQGAADRGLQLTVHAIGDRAVEQILSCYEAAGGHDPNRRDSGSCPPTSRTNRIEHAELLTSDQIARIARQGIILGVQPAFEHYWGGPGRMYERRLGERYRRTNPYRELLAAGVVLAGSSDAPITPVDPVLGIRSAVNHPVPEHSVRPIDACRMFTDWAALSLGLESRRGSLTAGHDADFVVVSQNPLQQADFSVLRVFRSGVELDSLHSGL